MAHHDATSEFRINANGARLDIWLLYRCRHCQTTRKRRLHKRISPQHLDPGLLLGYQRNDPALAWRHAFDIPVREALPYCVERAPVDAPALVRLDQPFPCGLRWDRLVAGELGLSRSAVARAWKEGQLAVAGVPSPSALARDHQELQIFLTLPRDGSEVHR